MTHPNTSVIIRQGGRMYISTGYETWLLLAVINKWDTSASRLKNFWEKHLIKQNDFIEWHGEKINDDGIEYGNIHYFPQDFN